MRRRGGGATAEDTLLVKRPAPESFKADSGIRWTGYSRSIIKPMLKARSFRSLLAGGLCLSLLFSSCQREGRRGAFANEAEPRYGGTLIVPIFSSAITRARLDPVVPSYEPIATMIFDRLAATEDQAGERIVPSLAESWEESPDGLVWRFRLREARFQDDDCFAGGIGRRVRADDVIYSWQRMIRALPAGYHYFGRFIAGALEYRDGRADAISGLRALDERTLEVHLVAPFVGFIRAVTWFPTSIVPREAVERYGEDFSKHPVGTGAFRLVEWDVNGGRITLARNPNYWGRDPQGHPLPYLNEIRYVLYPNQTTAFQAVVNGRAHMAPVPADLLDKIAERDSSGELRLRDEYAARDLHLISYRSPALGYGLYFNMDRRTPFTRDVRLRQAIGYVVRPPGESPLRPLLRPVPGVPPQDDKGFYYDPERARALLREAGYPEGHGLPALRLLINPATRVQSLDSIERVRELGIEVEEIVVNSIETEDLLRKGDYDLYIASVRSWGDLYPDVTSLLARFLSAAPPEENAARYRNPRFDALFTRIMAEKDESRRHSLVLQMEEMLLQDAVFIMIRTSLPDYQYVALRREAHVRGDGNINFRTTWLEV